MLRVLPLGGLGEIGMNCLALEERGEVIVIDCGVTFDDRGLGVDVIHPDFSALEPYADRIRGIVLTHGHEDHIGALPYFLKRFDVPVYGPPYTLGLVRERLAEHEVLEHARLIETVPRRKFPLGSFVVEPIRVTHSIADATALVVDTAIGKVIHTGDFKFDETPPDGEAFDEARLRELGQAGVSLLFSDSTNIDAEGVTGSEQGVKDALFPIVDDARGLVVVTMFASNVHRLRLLGDIAIRTGRKIVLLGRSVSVHSKVAHATGYLSWPSDLVFPADRAQELPKSRILAIATGSQAEANAALSKLSRGENAQIKLGEGDTVILSARIIPGNEREVYAMMGELFRLGVSVRTRVSDRGIHVSGHAHRAEQRRMLELVRPLAFIPVHGTLHHLLRHAALAREVGVPSVCVIENGTAAEVSAGKITRAEAFVAGRVHVWAGRAIAPSVLRDRAQLAQDGIAVIVLARTANGALAGEPEVQTRGVMDETADLALLIGVRREVREAIADLDPRAPDAELMETARLAARRSFARVLGRKPVTVVSLQHVGKGS